MRALRFKNQTLCADPELRHGWQHDDRRILDAVVSRLLPQKVPGS